MSDSNETNDALDRGGAVGEEKIVQVSTPSPFITRTGLDRYRRSSALYWFFIIIIVVYVIGFLAALVIVLNNKVVHSYTATFPPGTLVSHRYTTLRWVATMLAAMRLFVPIAVLNLILYRRTRGCSLLWLGFLFILVLIEVFVLLALWIDYGNCNGQNQFGNLCNDSQWCCVPEIQSNSANRCNRNIPCNPPRTLESLTSNVDFRWFFFTTLIFVLLDSILFFVPFGLWLTTYSSVYAIPELSETKVGKRVTRLIQDIDDETHRHFEDEKIRRARRRKHMQKKALPRLRATHLRFPLKEK